MRNIFWVWLGRKKYFGLGGGEKYFLVWMCVRDDKKKGVYLFFVFCWEADSRMAIKTECK
jgi:hypothetical protein